MKAFALLTGLVIAATWVETADAGCRTCNITAPNCGEGYVCAYDEGWGEACCLLETGEPDPDAGPSPSPSPSPSDAGDGGDGGDAGPEPTPSPSPWDAGDGGDADVDGGSDPGNCRYVCEGTPDGGDAASPDCWICDKPDAGGEGSGTGEGNGTGEGKGTGEGSGTGEGNGNSQGGNSNNAGSTARSVAGRPRDRGGCQDTELPPSSSLPPLALLALWGLRQRGLR